MAYRTGVSTSRGLSSLADHVGVSPVPLFDASSAAARRSGLAAARGGRSSSCSSGTRDALRGLNYAGWRRVGGKASAWGRRAPCRHAAGMGAHYGLSLAADARLPDVRYGDWHNLTGFDDDSAYSLVYSQNALNEGKMHYPRRELAPLLTSVARMLRPGGVALLHLFGCCPANDTTVHPPPSPAGCGGGAVESPPARRTKRALQKARADRGARCR